MWRDYLGLAIRALAAQKFRSILTVSSITLGAFSIVFMLSLATSGLTTLARDIDSFGGARLILIVPKIAERNPKNGVGVPGRFTRRDRELVFDALPFTSARTVYSSLEGTDVYDARGKFGRVDLVAADAGFFSAMRFEAADGRFFTEAENRQHARICVVSSEAAEKLFEGKAVGQQLTIGNLRCRVVGQVEKVNHWDVGFGFSWLDFVVVPIETLADIRPALRESSVMHMVTTDITRNDVVKRIANAILVDRHRGVDDYWIWDLSGMMKQFEAIFLMMKAVVGLIAGIALLVGGIGVMNMMLVSVSERTHEIGLRKALGASPRAISIQFLVEATVLSGVGGFFGAAGGVVATLGANGFIKEHQSVWVGVISVPAVMIAILVSLMIGVGFGLFPARRASRLDPVEALRR